MRNLICMLGLLFFVNGFSQTNVKNDIIVTADGQLLQVKVTKVADGTISFNYPGESVVNEIGSDGIEKIVFSSGRTQNFKGGGSTKSTPAVSQGGNGEVSLLDDIYSEAPAAPAAPSFEENSIAMIPAKFNRNQTYDKTLSGSATDFMVNLLSSKLNTTGLKVIPAREVVEKLVDAGVNYEKLRQASPEELRTILGTEYIMYVNIDENESGSKSSKLNLENAKSSDSSQLERTVKFRVYKAANEEEFYKVDFLEDLFTIKTENSATSLASGKWKSSLRYLTQQFFAANLFSE